MKLKRLAAVLPWLLVSGHLMANEPEPAPQSQEAVTPAAPQEQPEESPAKASATTVEAKPSLAVARNIRNPIKLNDGENRLIVCLDDLCTNPAPESLRETVEKYGFRTTTNKEEAEYRMVIKAYVTMSAKNKDGETIVAPVYATPLVMRDDAAQEKVQPWLGPDRDKSDDADKIKLAGENAWGLLSKEVRLYDTLWDQTGKLAQTIGGGSPAAYVAGFVLVPVLELFGKIKAKNDMKEGLAGVEMRVIGNKGFFNTVRTIHGYAASEREEDPGVLVKAAFAQALEGARSLIDASGDTQNATSQPAVAEQTNVGS